MSFRESRGTSCRGTCLLFLILCPGLEHLVETGGSETPRGVKEQDMLLEAQGNTGCNAQAHLGEQGVSQPSHVPRA